MLYCPRCISFDRSRGLRRLVYHVSRTTHAADELCPDPYPNFLFPACAAFERLESDEIANSGVDVHGRDDRFGFTVRDNHLP